MRKYDGNGESSPRETDAVAATMGPLYSPSIHYTSFLHYTPLLHIVLFLYIILYFYPIYSPFIHYTLSLHTLLVQKLASSLHHTPFTTLHYTPINNANQYIIVNRFIKTKSFHSARITLACAQRVWAVCATF